MQHITDEDHDGNNETRNDPVDEGIKQYGSPLVGAETIDKNIRRNEQEAEKGVELEKQKDGAEHGLEADAEDIAEHSDAHGAENGGEHVAEHVAGHGAEHGAEHGSEDGAENVVEDGADIGAQHGAEHGAEHEAEHGAEHGKPHAHGEHTHHGTLLCEGPHGPRTHRLEHICHIGSLTILGTFLIELMLKIWVNGSHYFDSWNHILDAIVVTVSFTFDLTYPYVAARFSRFGELQADLMKVPILIMRLWRIIRICHAASEVVHKGHDYVHELKEHSKELDEEVKELKAKLAALQNDSSYRQHVSRISQ